MRRTERSARTNPYPRKDSDGTNGTLRRTNPIPERIPTGRTKRSDGLTQSPKGFRRDERAKRRNKNMRPHTEGAYFVYIPSCFRSGEKIPPPPTRRSGVSFFPKKHPSGGAGFPFSQGFVPSQGRGSTSPPELSWRRLTSWTERPSWRELSPPCPRTSPAWPAASPPPCA